MQSKPKSKKKEEQSYHIKLDVFEGPFDLLFHLINKEEVDIWEIPLARITEQYLQYLQSMPEINVDLAGNFLIMAASLLHLKSRMLLPQKPSFLPEREEEALFFGSKEELVRCLLEYKRFKSIAVLLKEREDQQQRIFLRAPGLRVIIMNRQSSLSLYDAQNLKQAYEKLKKKNSALSGREKEKFFFEDDFSFADKLKEIVEALEKKMVRSCSLSDFLVKGEKKEVVVTFFILLELAKRGRLSLCQERLFGQIIIEKS